MILNLPKKDFPVRIAFTPNDGRCSSTVAVFQYADGKILTASALVLDPADWRDAEIQHTITRPIYSPGWAGKTDAEMTNHFYTRANGMLGKFGGQPITLAVGVRLGKPTARVCPPKSVTKIGAEDAVSDEDAFGPRS